LSFIRSTRWLTIVSYAFLATIFVRVLSKADWSNEIFTWWLTAFNSFNMYWQGIFSIIIGFLLNQWLAKTYVYGEYVTLNNLLKYPPITVSALIAIIMLTTTVEKSTNVLFFLLSEQAPVFYCLLIGLVIMPLKHSYPSVKKLLKLNKNLVPYTQRSISTVTEKSSYEQYQKWFYDDTPISDITQLSDDLQTYVDRISTRIADNKSKGVHIALCGDFGTGKSSIIKCVQKQLSTEFIYSNVDTWGTDYRSINAVVLGKVIADVSCHIDMCAFKGLPSQYIEALKLGNNVLKILAIFSGVSVDPREGLIKLNAVLCGINKKLLITIQDIDRSSNPIKTSNELAALLDKLKDLNNISFIIALGYENKLSEVIRKVCDYREDLIKVDHCLDLFNFIDILNDKAKVEGIVTSSRQERSFKLLAHSTEHPNPYSAISSERSLKNICRRVDAVWQEGKLIGEIDLDSLCLLIILREELPFFFESVIKNKNILIGEVNRKKDVEPVFLNKLVALSPPTFDLKTVEGFLIYLLDCTNELNQGAFYKYDSNKYKNYLNRVLLETVPGTEIRDQDAINLLDKVNKDSTQVDLLINHFQTPEKGNHWIEAYQKFQLKFLKPQTNQVYEKIYLEMVDYYYKDTIKYPTMVARQVNNKYVQNFLHSLLEECLASENVVRLFEQTLKIPIIFCTLMRRMNCLEFFLSKDKEDTLYDVFLNTLKKDSEMSSRLLIVDSFNPSNPSLSHISEIFIRHKHTTEQPITLVVWKDIVLALIEKNTKSEDTYKFHLWFICYVFASSPTPEEVIFTFSELKSIKSALTYLSNEEIEEYFNVATPEKYRQNALDELDNLIQDFEPISNAV
jgi:hypothetical protein